MPDYLYGGGDCTDKFVEILNLKEISTVPEQRRLEKDKLPENIYHDVDEGFGSARDLFEQAQRNDPGVSID